MAAAARITKSVLILAPRADDDPQQLVLCRMAARTAFKMGLMPLIPTAYCMVFMTPEELSRKLREVSLWWLRRVSRIWLCAKTTEEVPVLDPLTHDILIANEGLLTMPNGRWYKDPTRLRVACFDIDAEAENPKVTPLQRKDLAHILRCNLTAGLFRGVEM